jgi:hypothetical protein
MGQKLFEICVENSIYGPTSRKVPDRISSKLFSEPDCLEQKSDFWGILQIFLEEIME